MVMRSLVPRPLPTAWPGNEAKSYVTVQKVLYWAMLPVTIYILTIARELVWANTGASFCFETLSKSFPWCVYTYLRNSNLYI